MTLAEQPSLDSVDEKIGGNTLVEDENLEQYLTFIMNGEEYGVDILSVQEIRGWEPVTPIPNAPVHVKGVVNLRGIIVPIVDLRAKFNLDSVEYGPLTVVIVLRVSFEDGERVMGVVVDAVSDVYGLSLEDMQAAPDLGDHVNTSYIRGLAAVDEKMIIVLDIDALLENDMRNPTELNVVH